MEANAVDLALNTGIAAVLFVSGCFVVVAFVAWFASLSGDEPFEGPR